MALRAFGSFMANLLFFNLIQTPNNIKWVFVLNKKDPGNSLVLRRLTYILSGSHSWSSLNFQNYVWLALAHTKAMHTQEKDPEKEFVVFLHGLSRCNIPLGKLL